jgi:hypothetical protein
MFGWVEKRAIKGVVERKKTMETTTQKLEEEVTATPYNYAHPHPAKPRQSFPPVNTGGELRSPRTLMSHKITALTTTAFKIDLMEPAIGMRRC